MEREFLVARLAVAHVLWGDAVFRLFGHGSLAVMWRETGDVGDFPDEAEWE